MAAASVVGEARAVVLCDDPDVGESVVNEGWSRRGAETNARRAFNVPRRQGTMQ
jgi:hypothetical protein